MAMAAEKTLIEIPGFLQHKERVREPSFLGQVGRRHPYSQRREHTFMGICKPHRLKGQPHNSEDFTATSRERELSQLRGHFRRSSTDVQDQVRHTGC